jgi:CubicO group peptidase (beta-lactamase class C family)
MKSCYLFILLLILTGDLSRSGGQIFRHNEHIFPFGTGSNIQNQEPPKADLGQTITEFESWINDQLKAKKWPGVAVAILDGTNLVWAKGFGVNSLETNESVTTKTKFRVASMSKMFTAIATRKLIESGQLDSDQPLQDYLGRWFQLSGPEDKAKIKLRHLLNHTAGIARDIGYAYWSEAKYWENGRLPDENDFRKKIDLQEVIYPPGSRMKYTNLGYILLGEAIGHRLGDKNNSVQRYTQYVNDHILSPLKMENSGFVLSAEESELFAQPYGPLRPDGTREQYPMILDPGVVAPAAGLYSTVEDLTSFAKWLRRNRGSTNEIVSSRGLRKMMEPSTFDPKLVTGTYGQGFTQMKLPSGQYVVGHGGVFIGYISDLEYSPKMDVTVIVLSNAGDFDSIGFVDKALTLVGQAIVDQRPKLPLPNDFEKYLGKYTNASRGLEVSSNGQGLLSMPFGTLVPIRGHQFRIESATSSSFDGEIVSFEFDAKGNVSGFDIGNGSYRYVKVK